MRLIPKRRWLRFSTRTLLVAVTIFCVWLGWEVSIVQERKNVLQLISEREGDPFFGSTEADEYLGPEIEHPPVHAPWHRRIMGDSPLWYVRRGKMSDAEVLRVQRAFPEAEFIRSHCSFGR